MALRPRVEGQREEGRPRPAGRQEEAALEASGSRERPASKGCPRQARAGPVRGHGAPDRPAALR